jgi:predicted transcriptional regulator
MARSVGPEVSARSRRAIEQAAPRLAGPARPVAYGEVLPFPIPRSPSLDGRPLRGRPLALETIAVMRLLFERTGMTYREIAERTGVCQSSISNYAQAGCWQRPPEARKPPTIPAHGILTPRLKGRVLARRLRQVCERWLDDMDQLKPCENSPLDIAWVEKMLQMAKEEEHPTNRYRALAARARKVAEDILDDMERAPEKNPSDLASALKMLEVAREEEARPIRQPGRKRLPEWETAAAAAREAGG